MRKPAARKFKRAPLETNLVLFKVMSHLPLTHINHISSLVFSSRGNSADPQSIKPLTSPSGNSANFQIIKTLSSPRENSANSHHLPRPEEPRRGDVGVFSLYTRMRCNRPSTQFHLSIMNREQVRSFKFLINFLQAAIFLVLGCYKLMQTTTKKLHS